MPGVTFPPHVMHLRDVVTAANASFVDTMLVTFTRSGSTSAEEPPASGAPKVTVVPSILSAAKARSVLKIVRTSLESEANALDGVATILPPLNGDPKVTTPPASFRVANTFAFPKMATMFERYESTAADEPPPDGSPQATRVLSSFSAANAMSVEAIVVTLEESAIWVSGSILPP